MNEITVNRNDLVKVFNLAVVTEDRSDKEQAALDRIAKRLDETAR